MNEVISAFLGMIILFPFIVTIVLHGYYAEDGKAPASSSWACSRCHNSVLISSGLYRIADSIWTRNMGLHIGRLQSSLRLSMPSLNGAK